jgi:hypothetical protein
MEACPFFRDRVVADKLLVFKLGVEVALDAGLATFTELFRRAPGTNWLEEVEFFTTDVLVGGALNVAMVLLIATPATMGRRPVTAFTGALGALTALPAAALAKAPKGASYNLVQRAAGVARTGVAYGVCGFTAGLVGQLTANVASTVRRTLHPEHFADVHKIDKHKHGYEMEMPPSVRTATVWGIHSAVSSNGRYQLIAGLDRAVWALPVSKTFIALPAAVTAVARFCNNIVGGEHFASQARWAGVQ